MSSNSPQKRSCMLLLRSCEVILFLIYRLFDSLQLVSVDGINRDLEFGTKFRIQ